MTFIIVFEDDPEADPGIRGRLMAEHLAFLETKAPMVRAAGPMSDRAEAPAGGLWIVDAPSFEAVEALVREDPLWPTGLRKSVRVLRWTQVFADGARRIAPA